MERKEITQLIESLIARQADVSREVMRLVQDDDLEEVTEDGFTVRDILQMWSHEIRSHHRDLILARGRLTGDNPHFHIPHFVRQANEEFGKFMGELSALTDKDLERRIEPDARTIREIAGHVLSTLEGYFIQQLRTAVDKGSDEQGNPDVAET